MEQHGISKLDLKRQNRMQVLKILKQKGPASRIDIAATLALTRASVTIITNEMIEQGVIVELGEYKHTQEKAPRGRKKILIDINDNYKFALGVYIDTDIVSVGLSTISGQILDKKNYELSSESDLNNILSYVRSGIKSVLQNNCLSENNVLGIGVAVFPKMYKILEVEEICGKYDFSRLEKKFSRIIHVPVVADNSVKAVAMANIDFAKDKKANRDNLAVFQYGSQLYFSMIGLNDYTSKYDNCCTFVNKMIVNPGSRNVCTCGRRGCAESEISFKVLKDKIVREYERDATPILYKLTNGDSSKINSETVFRAYRSGEKSVCDIIEHAIYCTAILINNLVIITNPQKLILHGVPISDDLYIHMKKVIEEVAGKAVAERVQMSRLDKNISFLSGAALAIRQIFYNSGGNVSGI